MKVIEALIAGLVVMLASVGVGAALVGSVFQSNQSVPLTSSETPVVIDVPRDPIRTVCRSNDAQMELCVSSDGRGLFSVFDGVQTSRYMYVFYDEPGGCPQAMPGYQVRVSDWAVRELQFFGFSPDDFLNLQISPYYCTFAPVS